MMKYLPENPNSDKNTSEIYRRIVNDPLKFPDEMGKDARDLITQLLSPDPESQLHSNSAEEVNEHPFFKSSMSAVRSLRFNGLTVFHFLS
jgi:serine/threonine protein kinase